MGAWCPGLQLPGIAPPVTPFLITSSQTVKTLMDVLIIALKFEMENSSLPATQ